MGVNSLLEIDRNQQTDCPATFGTLSHFGTTLFYVQLSVHVQFLELKYLCACFLLINDYMSK